VPDAQTLEALGYQRESSSFTSSSTIPTLSHKDLSRFHSGSPLKPLHQRDGSPDELMRIELERNLVLQGRLLHNLTYLGEYINPSVTYFCDHLLLATGLAWGITEGRAATEHVEFRWLNHPFAPFPATSKGSGESSYTYFGVSGKKLAYLDVPMVGQDPRMVVYNDTLVVTFTYRFSNVITMGMSRVVCNRSAQVVHVVQYDNSFYFQLDPQHDQKNWSPFFYSPSDSGKNDNSDHQTNQNHVDMNGQEKRGGEENVRKDKEEVPEILLIQCINPLTVVKVVRPPNNEYKYATVFSKTAVMPLQWRYGDLRGGTNAILLSMPNCYFAFFHTSHQLAGNPVKTYFMGAYTFSTKPPFQLLSVSPLPIMDEALYTGPWNPLRLRRIDYVPFPSTIFLRGEEVILSLGHQDHAGYLAAFNLQELLRSLKPVNGSRWEDELPAWTTVSSSSRRRLRSSR
jgi:hypothetical protein